MKICIASPDVVGPIANGGVGTACTALAQALAAAGHAVTLFYTANHFERWSGAQCQAFYAGFGIEFLVLDRGAKPPPSVSPTVHDEDNVARAYFVYEQLKQADFDLVHFADYLGTGYFCALAKAQGLHFQSTLLAVTAHAPTLWARLANAAPLDDVSYLVRDQLERGLLAHCDLLISPSRYMLDWLAGQGWRLPSHSAVLPNLLPRRSRDAAPPRPRQLGPVRELVFFGRLEARKGLLVFCDAIDRLGERLPRDVEVTFLGKPGLELPPDWLQARTAHWPSAPRFLTDLDTFQALDYLREDGRLAVLAALSDNSPYTVLECLAHGIPFLATKVGGVAELIAEDDRSRVLCAPTPAGLAEAIAAALAQPDARPARAAFDAAENERQHLALHAEAAARTRQPSPPTPAPTISVSVVLLHRERPAALRQALASLAAQSRPADEIVVVDNGSRGAEALALLDELESAGNLPLRVLRLPENLYEPAARNAGARAAGGSYLLFMDDDNLAKPREVELFLRAAQGSGADVLTCFCDHFVNENPPEDAAEALKRFVALGDAGPLGLLLNGYGDANCFCRRDRFLEVGGFVEDGRFNHAEDWRFFVKAWGSGLTLAVVPEALFWYRAPRQAGWRKQDRGGALQRAAEAYLPSAPPEVRPFLLLAQGLFWRAAAAEQARRAAEEDLQATRRRQAQAEEQLANLRAETDGLRQDYGLAIEFLESVPVRRFVRTAEQRRLAKYLKRVAGKYVGL